MQHFESIMVIGAGQMGSGIAQSMAMAGLPTTLVDKDSSQVSAAKENILKSLEKFASKGMLQESVKTIFDKLNFASNIQVCLEADLVIEAIVEDFLVKAELFRMCDKEINKRAIFASNTSSIPITRLAAVTKRPESFIGMHFMNPAPIMKLVEVIRGAATSEEVVLKISSLARILGKEVTLVQDYPGFAVNRILMPMINEAFNALMQGVASAEDIDRAMILGTNQPMGPLALADFIGLDTVHSILGVLHDGFGSSHYKPSPLLAQYVQAGFLGRKSHRGVFKY